MHVSHLLHWTWVERQNFYSPFLHEEPCKSALAPDTVHTLLPSFHWTAKCAGSKENFAQISCTAITKERAVFNWWKNKCFACTQLKVVLRNSNIGIMLSQIWASPIESICFASVTAVFCLFSLCLGFWPPVSEWRLRYLAQMQPLSPALLTADNRSPCKTFWRFNWPAGSCHKYTV